MESFLDPARQRHQAHAGHLREGGVVRVERLDDESLLPFAGAGHHREEDCLAAARRREDLVQRKRDPETRVVLLERRKILRGSAGRSVGVDLLLLEEPRRSRIGAGVSRSGCPMFR